MKNNRLNKGQILLALTTAVALTTAAPLIAADAPAKPATAASESTGKVSVKELLANPKQYSGKKVEVQGFVTDYCKRKGCWAMIHDNNPDNKQQIRVKQNESGNTFKAFLPEHQGKTVSVVVEVNETKIDKDYLDKWEEKVKSAKPAADAEAKKEALEKANKATLKQIADYRDRVAKSKEGYLVSLSFAADSWQLKPEAK